ncbi:asparagine synthase [Micromonospora sp. ATCC 39149]|nr:asparagine synthase [Micromonospora sp. ATCC 39149]
MCGIALSIGPEADPATFRRMLAVLAPRGEVTETRREANLLAGTRRLRIVDRERAVQPWVSADERLLLCYNGEVFNHRELRAELTRLGHLFRSASDTEVVLVAFERWGEDAVHRLRGEYAFVVVERATGRAYLARDPLGVKPLYWSRVPGCLHLASEVKALVGHGAPVGEVPPGHHGWAEPGGHVRLHPYVDVRTLGDGLPVVDDPDEAALLVRAALTDSIRTRVDTDLTVRAIADGRARPDYTVLEHARDLVGAAKWNAAPVVRRLAGPRATRRTPVG